MPSTPLSAIAARKAKATSLSSSSPVTLRPAVPAPQLADLEHTIAASSPVTPKSGSTNGKNRNRDSKVAGGKSPAKGSATHKRRQQAARYYGMESEAGPSAGASDVESSSDERNGAQEDEADEVEDHHMSDASSSLDFGLEEEVSAGRPKKRRRMENGCAHPRSDEIQHQLTSSNSTEILAIDHSHLTLSQSMASTSGELRLSSWMRRELKPDCQKDL